MELREGYKQTEVGVIPEDWQVEPIGSLGTFTKGQGIRKNEAASGDIRCVRYGEIYTYHDDIIRSFNSRISVEVAMTSKRLKKDDLLFAGSGETKGEIGKCIAFVGNEEVYAGGDIVILSPTKGDSKFLSYLFNSPVAVRQKSSKGQGDAVVHISASALSSITIPLPPTKTEQTAIANALSDADALIQSLARLIVKKRQIKQGAMQTLLNPYENGRLKAGWVVKKLGDVLRIGHGKSQHEVIDENGDYPILASGGEIGRANKYLYNKPSVLIGRKGTIDVPQYMDKPFWTIDTLFYTEVFEPNNAKYLFYQFNLIDWYSYNEASGVPSLSARTIENIDITVPLPEEQNSITTILSDMDAGITVLETKLAKTQQIKQGMMQNLLTGRIRLL